MNEIEKLPLNIKLVLVSAFFMFVSFASMIFSITLGVTITQKILNVIIAFFFISIVFGFMSITLTLLKRK